MRPLMIASQVALRKRDAALIKLRVDYTFDVVCPADTITPTFAKLARRNACAFLNLAAIAQAHPAESLEETA
jgi:hypothetical protein